jgi:hypothetical protein
VYGTAGVCARATVLIRTRRQKDINESKEMPREAFTIAPFMLADV